ncbi:DUF1549 domain-containing protein [Allorhodopirellula heiligendammensis]|uniref:Planctomycete cytochrome C n=1 Tax=Allorhodopirellula heiligendammensis TaxID=2714739 RepID=A0A5C6C242_9BACT|nr:DUF1549 domain-containing protein [Allorhodopirellula heiligendammensis]TWU18640.1 Planctomycete cytochrome C [Allorhodopirellula heiligendammensis]
MIIKTIMSAHRNRAYNARQLGVTVGLLISLILSPAGSASDVPLVEQPVSFQADVLPLLRTKCFGCHQGAKQLGEYQMTEFAGLLRGGESGETAIVPGDAEASYLITQIVPVGGIAEMPKSPQQPLAPAEIELIRRWINEGANNDLVATGPRYTSANPPQYLGPPTIPSIDLSPDEKTLAIAGNYEVILLDSASGKQLSRLVGMSPRINSVAFSHDGASLAAVGGTPGEVGELQVWNVETGQLQLSKTITYDTLTGVSWSPDDSHVALGANDNTVRAIDAATGEQILYQGAHEDWIRDTVFTNDGKHVVSVARDMTCKLTEVSTQRFVDNVTSITPGALSGGLSSIAIHPQRDEIVVGGADGIVKIYRVFRNTARKIGDDANLLQRLPALAGRINTIAVSRSGNFLAAIATIDNNSEVRVWRYYVDTAKPVSEQTAAQTLHYQLPGVAAYTLDLTNDGAVWIGACDGTVRHLDPAGALLGEFHVADAAAETTLDAAAFDAEQWTRRQNEQIVNSLNNAATNPPSGTESATVDTDTITTLTISPAKLRLHTPYEYVQLVAVATLEDGQLIDVTNQVVVQPHAAVAVQSGGLIRPLSDAAGELIVRIGTQQQAIPFEFTGHGNVGVDFIRDVNPVLSRLGCNQGTCHGAQKGKNGFRLSLRGYDPIFDIRALTDDLAARRINPAAPESSLMLRKPLGLTPHEGGTLVSPGDPYHAILRQWIAAGSHLNLDTPRVTSLELFPSNPVVQSTSAHQQVRVVAYYADGTSRDVTREAVIESGNTEVATAQSGGVLRAIRRGEAPVLARYEGAYAATTLTVMGDREGYHTPQVPEWNRIDGLVAQKWERMQIVPSDIADDATFLRRIHLDLTGLPPASAIVREFLADPTPTQEKRNKIIDQLIGNDDFVVFWTNKWADLLQVNRKFLGVEGSRTYREWIRQAVAENRPYDEVVRQILTASGSNHANPPASYFKGSSD